MKKNIISVYIILMILALNCYSPSLTYNASLWNNLNFEREHQNNPEDYRIYAVKKAFEEANLAYTRINRNQNKEQPLSKKIKNMQRETQEIKKNSSESTIANIKTPNKHFNNENKKLALLKLGVNKEKIIDNDDTKNASFFLFT